ncbi:MAG: hypothetical protein ACJ74H_02220 [Thermoanaerobaculia bacterium]
MVIARRWTRRTFLCLALLHLLPLCSVRYLPTGDGPTHVYNAWVLHELLSGEPPPNIARAYRVDWKPHPNWSGHAFMALAMTAVPPLIAEKLLVALILASILGGTWFLATSIDPRNDVYAFLAFPFTWTQTLVAGYYNFSLSIGLYLIILGVWWRRGSVLLLAALLVLCYFTHPMAALLACGSIVLLSLLTRRFAHLPALIPAIALLAIFGRTEQSNVGAPLQLKIDWTAASILARIDTLFAFDNRIRPIAIALALIYVGLIVVTLLHERRREQTAMAILALALIATMFWIPAAQGTRDLFTGRMQPFVFLILPACFTPRIADRWRNALFALLSLIAIATAAIAFERVRTFGREMGELVRRFDAIEPGTTLLPLICERPHSRSFVNVFAHFISYVALEKRLVDLSNYEPFTQVFPIAHRVPLPGSHVLENAPELFDFTHPAVRADFLVTHRLPENAPYRVPLRTLYRLIHEDGDFQIYRRQSPLLGPRDLILLPILGTPPGTRWSVDQTLRNRDSRPMRVLLRPCPNDVWCDRELAPGEVIPIATWQQRFAFLDVPREHVKLEITTVVRRVDLDTSFPIPAVPIHEFSRGGASIAGIDTIGKTIALRVYAFGNEPRQHVTLRVRSSGRIVTEQRLAIENFGRWENAELRVATGGLLPAAIDVEVLAAQDTNVWAFVTATDEHGRSIVLRSQPHAASGDPSAADRRDPDRRDVHDLLRDRR